MHAFESSLGEELTLSKRRDGQLPVLGIRSGLSSSFSLDNEELWRRTWVEVAFWDPWGAGSRGAFCCCGSSRGGRRFLCRILSATTIITTTITVPMTTPKEIARRGVSSSPRRSLSDGAGLMAAVGRNHFVLGTFFFALNNNKILIFSLEGVARSCKRLKWVARCCGKLKWVKRCCRKFKWLARCGRKLKWVAISCKMMKWVARCCGTLKCVAICCRKLKWVAAGCRKLK